MTRALLFAVVGAVAGLVLVICAVMLLPFMDWAYRTFGATGGAAAIVATLCAAGGLVYGAFTE